MNYSATVSWMFSQLPMYQRQGKAAYKSDLTNTIKLAEHLIHPELKFKAVHVAGTNGKGSTSHMLASILQEAGYKVGLYTSPHLKDFRERIKINGKEVSKQFVIQFINRNKTFFETQKLSFFEMTLGMAFDYFAKQRVDMAVVEVGLGGRLDSTNIITPEVSVITNIGFDHMQFLGDTIESIAGEKAGIIKKNVPVVIGETQLKTKPIFLDRAKKLNAPIVFADQNLNSDYHTDLKGQYQKLNVRTAVATVEQLKNRGFRISKSHIKNGLLHVVNNTGLLGRWQVLGQSPMIICDTAHNKEGLTLTMNQLKSMTFDKLHLVLGFVNDKDIDSLIDLFPENAIYYFCKPSIERGLDVEKLRCLFLDKNRIGEDYESASAALLEAKNKAKKDDLIYIGGSTFVVADIL